MTNKWYQECQDKYDQCAVDLVNRGFSRTPRGDIYKEQFTKDEKTLVIVRHLGSSNWWTKEL